MGVQGVRGIPGVLTAIKQFGAEAERLVNAETEAIVIQIEADAKRNAPKNLGKLAQSISHEKYGDHKWKVVVGESYGAYMEFGTGTKVKVPAEFKNMAEEFKGGNSGSYEEGLESIKLWCRSKGIPEEAAHVIFAKILGAGINPQPFLYPAWVKGQKDYLKNLERILSRLQRRT